MKCTTNLFRSNSKTKPQCPLWRRVVSLITTLAMLIQVVMPAYASAAYALSSEQIAAMLANTHRYLQSAPEYQTARYESAIFSNQDDIFNGQQYLIDRLQQENEAALPERTLIPIGVDEGIITFIPESVELPKPVGTPYVDRELIKNQIEMQVNRKWIPGYENFEDQANQLYHNAVRLAQQWELKFGQPLPADKVAQLPYDVIWPELREVAGQQVLVPIVYLSKTTLNTRITGNVVTFGEANLDFKQINIDGGHIQLRRNALVNVRESFINQTGTLEAQDLVINAGRNIVNHSGTISGNDLKLVAEKIANSTLVIRHNQAYGYTDTVNPIGAIKVLGDLDITARQDVINVGGSLSAQGNITVDAGGNIQILAQQSETKYEYNSKIWTVKEQTQKNIPSTINAGDGISLTSDKEVVVQGSQIIAEEFVEILAKLGIRILNEVNTHSFFEKFEIEVDGLFGDELESTEEQFLRTQIVRSLIQSGHNIAIRTEMGDIVLKAISLNSGGDAEIISENGEVHLPIAKERDFYSYSSADEGTFSFKYEGHGHNRETAFYNHLLANGILRLDAKNGFKVEYAGEGSLDEIVDDLSKAPELAWLKQVREKTSPADWAQIELALESWDYKAQGLTKAAAAIIAIVVAVVTAGAGAAALAGITTNTIAIGMAQAAITNLATQATISLASGNSVGETLKSLGSKESIRSLATAVVTAGVLEAVDVNVFGEAGAGDAAAQTGSTASNTSILANIPAPAAQGLQLLTHATIRVGVDRLINGKGAQSFSDSLVQAMALESVNQLGESLAGKIGNANISDASRYILHAALGCALGAATTAVEGDNSDDNELACVSGAGGAVIGEFVAEQYFEEFNADIEEWREANKEYTIDEQIAWINKWRARGANLSGLAAGLVAFATGGNVNIAETTAKNAALNNALAFDKLKPEQQQALVLAALTFDGLSLKRELSEEEKQQASEYRQWAQSIPDDHPYKAYADVILNFSTDADIVFHLTRLHIIDWQFGQEALKQIKIGDEVKIGLDGKPILETVQDKLNDLEERRNQQVAQEIQALIHYNSGQTDRVTAISELVISLGVPGGPLTLRSFKSFFSSNTKVKLGPWMDDPKHPNWKKLTPRQLQALGGRNLSSGKANPASALNLPREILKNNLQARMGLSNKFNLNFTDAELSHILAEGRKLQLDDDIIEDFVFIASRDAKRISETELIKQMRNYVNIVKVRGYPFKFTSKKEFAQFQAELLGELNSVGIPTKDVRIQGSSLRTPQANDVDLAVFVSDDEFFDIIKKGFNNKVRVSGGNVLVDLNNKTNIELVSLAKKIDNNPKSYNANASTFSNAILNSTVSSKSKLFKPLKAARKNIDENYPHLNIEAISVMRKGGNFDLKPMWKLDI